MQGAAGLFYRLSTDQRTTSVALEGTFAGPQTSACWLIGGGPSLNALPVDQIAASPLPRMCMNLTGSGKLRPTFWTSYDPTVRFHRSIYLDPGVLKFVHRRRAMDLVPETTVKVCECPATFFFDRESGRGFSDLLSPQATGIVDWADSMVQAIDLLYRLGFRRLYLAGCDMRIDPSLPQIERAEKAGIQREQWSSLADFVKTCGEHGIGQAELELLGAAPVYHFPEKKSLSAAVQTDAHYFRIVQSLRLSRQCLATQGMELISVTPGSRLNDFFPYQRVEEALAEIHQQVGNPATEETQGLYTQKQPRWREGLGPMRDVKPPNWPTNGSSAKKPGGVGAEPTVEVEAEGWLAGGKRFAETFKTPVEQG